MDVGDRKGAFGGWVAKGYYMKGAKLVGSVLDIIWKKAEGMDALWRFQNTHSFGGDTTAGMGTLLVSKICYKYPNQSVYKPFSNYVLCK